jgi:hypothetical protein
MIDETLNQPAAPGAPIQAPQMEPQAAPPAPPPQEQAPAPKQSVWKSVVQGALIGLSNSGGATSFGGGLGAGAQGVMNKRVQDQQMEMAQQKEQRLATNDAAQVKFYNAQAAHFAAEAAYKDKQIENMPEVNKREMYKLESDFAEKLITAGWMPSEIIDSTKEGSGMEALGRAAANDPRGMVGNRITAHVGNKVLTFSIDNVPGGGLGVINRGMRVLGMPEVDSKSVKALPAELTARAATVFNPTPKMTAGQVSEYEEYVEKAKLNKLPEEDVAALERALAVVTRAYNQKKSDDLTLVNARGEGLGKNRAVPVINPETGELEYRYVKDAVAQPGQDGASPAAGGTKALSGQAQMNEMLVASKSLRSIINQKDRSGKQVFTPFTPAQVTKLEIAMNTKDSSVAQANLKALASQNLTPAQRTFVVWVAQIHERALSIRAVASMGQGSDDLRAAIKATLPGVGSGNLEMMNEQLDAFDQQVKLLQQGVPKVKGQANMLTSPESQKPKPPEVQYADNPETGESIMSTDGGKTWQAAQ